jgi:hypothetical protein
LSLPSVHVLTEPSKMDGVVCVCAWLCVRAYVSLYVFVCLYLFVCLCVYVCVCELLDSFAYSTLLCAQEMTKGFGRQPARKTSDALTRVVPGVR